MWHVVKSYAHKKKFTWHVIPFMKNYLWINDYLKCVWSTIELGLNFFLKMICGHTKLGLLLLMNHEYRACTYVYGALQFMWAISKHLKSMLVTKLVIVQVQGYWCRTLEKHLIIYMLFEWWRNWNTNYVSCKSI